LICWKYTEEVERIDLTKGQSTEKIHILVQDLGLKRNRKKVAKIQEKPAEELADMYQSDDKEEL